LRQELANIQALMAKLGSEPHIVKLIDVNAEGRPHPFLALEYVGGGSLEDWILSDKARRPSLRKEDVMRGMVTALARAHEKGIYHRDLKPANILLTESPDVQPKIADFG